MRRTPALTLALLTAALLVAGCGGGGGTEDDSPAKAKDASQGSPSKGEAKGSAEEKSVPHEVVFEVGGKGTTQVMWNGNSNHFEEVTLPWTKKETVQLEGAELTVGVTLSVVPGSVTGSDGLLVPAPCTIKVDGKQVADNEDGKSPKPCEYKLKG